MDIQRWGQNFNVVNHSRNLDGPFLKLQLSFWIFYE